jgi:lon-related putative ATP-dependent protease
VEQPSTKMQNHRLSTGQLRRICDPLMFHFASTEELPPLDEVIGQERAVRAVSFGIDIQSSGYNIYALGPAGTGKTTTIRKFLEQKAAAEPVPDDWCYAFNFGKPETPRALRLPAGKGRQLQRDMNRLVGELETEVPRAFEGEKYAEEQEQIQADFQKRQQALVQDLEKEAETRGLRLVQTPRGLMILPLVNGEVVMPEKFELMNAEDRRKIEGRQNEIQDRLRETMRRVRQLYLEAREQMQEVDREVIGFAIQALFEELEQKYSQHKNIQAYLADIRTHIMDNVQTLRQLQDGEQMPVTMMAELQQSWFDQYKVNLIVDNRHTQGAPVVMESHPTYHNLIGRIQYQSRLGALVTDFGMIRAGALHRANGGYLVLDVLQVLTKPFAWDALKRALKNQEIKIEPMGEEFNLIATKTLEPEPIPLDVKIVVLGDPILYYLLYNVDDDFRELFKVKADFAAQMDWEEETALKYAHFIGSLCREENLKHFDPSGVARVVEEGARMVNHQRKLGTKFGEIVDLIHQASYWASHNGNSLVKAADVQRAIDEKTCRSNQLEERLNELIEEETLLIDTEGDVVGQVNGISVFPLGDYSFGKPSRITARTYVGTGGIVNIERETKLAGRIHNKGTMILSGYLGGAYAQDEPLALAASVTFEQIYEEVEGDSATAAELYALLSSLSGFPIKQSLAVTGSVNQRGQIQAIGGVNEKIEGFFQVCKIKGLTGTQGVIIPQSNVKNLMLHHDIVAAVEEKQFHIYAISTADEGMAILTGKEAGERRLDGSYPEGTINRAVQDRLRELAQRVRSFAHVREGEPPNQTNGV